MSAHYLLTNKFDEFSSLQRERCYRDVSGYLNDKMAVADGSAARRPPQNARSAEPTELTHCREGRSRVWPRCGSRPCSVPKLKMRARF